MKSNKLILLCLLCLSLYSQTCDDSNCMQCSEDGEFCLKCSNTFTLQQLCIKPLCTDPHCSQCDKKMNFCQSCSVFYPMGVHNCQIKPAVITIPLCVLFVFVIISLCKCYVDMNRNSNSITQSVQPEKILQNSIFFNAIQGQHQKKIQRKCSTELTLNQVSNNDKISCVICFESECNVVTLCRHYFHDRCLRKWIRNSKTCPLCNSKICKRIKKIVCQKCGAYAKISSTTANSQPYYCQQCK